MPMGAALVRAGGLAAVAAGLIFAAIQPIHPPDVLSSVATEYWAAMMITKLVMCLLFLIGITSIYAKQVDRAGWLGLGGFLLLIVSWWLQTAYVFAEAFILPVVSTDLPAFVDSFLGIVNGSPGEMAIGGLPPVYGVVGLSYMIGGLLFGIATFRAKVLPRSPALLWAVAAAVTPAAALLPHALQRYAAIPVAIAIAWLGYAVWSKRGAFSSANAAPVVA